MWSEDDSIDIIQIIIWIKRPFYVSRFNYSVYEQLNRDSVGIPRTNHMIVCIYAMYKTIHL